MPESYFFRLSIERLQLHLHLGVGDEERQQKQRAELSIAFYFTAMPNACHDESATFLCYDKIVRRLAAYVADKPFKLIEFLGQKLLEELRAYLQEAMPEHADGIRILLTLNKCDGPVEAIKGGARVTLTDLPGGVPVG